MTVSSLIHPHIRAVMQETGEDDPRTAVRTKAQSVVRQFRSAFDDSPPFNLDALASFRGLRHSTDAPEFSKDSEIAPQADGHVVLRVNRDRPLTRQRFSIGHEIGHTLFPEYQVTVRCRKAADRDWADPENLLETLCDVAASEFLFPEPWFHTQVHEMTLCAAGVVQLTKHYEASPEATVRRLVEIHSQPLAAVFFSWKLKPTEIRQRANDRRQRCMFPDDELPEAQPKLRVDYAILNDGFARKFGNHIPKDKSIQSEGPIYASSMMQEPRDGSFFLDLGRLARDLTVYAVPIYTPEESVGPGGGVSVVAVLQPLRS